MNSGVRYFFELLAKTCCVLLLLIQFNRPWGEFVWNPIWLPGCNFKILIVDTLWLLKLLSLIGAIYLFKKRRNVVFPITIFIFWIVFIYTPKWLFVFPDYIQRNNGQLKYAYKKDGKYVVVTYKKDGSSIIEWPKNDTFQVIDTELVDKSEMSSFEDFCGTFLKPCY